MPKALLRTLAVAGALAAAAIVAFSAIVGSGSPPSATGSRAPSPATHTTATGSPAPSATAPLRRSGPARIPPGPPQTITIPAIGVHTAVRSVVSTHQRGLWVIIPPMATNADLRRVYWWSEHAAPAAPSDGTAYIYGHACSHYALCAFNHLYRLATGDLVTVTTVRGALAYRVAAKPVRLAKTAAGIGDSFIYNYGAVNRLVLITCGYAPDGSSPWNWAVVTQLTAATPVR
jgi:hypothetical protein